MAKKTRKQEEMNPRTCIVTREEKQASEMIRFVADPDGNVVVDINAKLPGRGVWVTAHKSHVEKAVVKQAFSHGLKCKAKASDALAEQTGNLLGDAATRSLAMARKAGLVIAGFDKVEAEIRKGEIQLICLAKEAANDGVKKMLSAVRSVEMMGAEPVHVCRELSSDQLGQITGRENVMNLAVKFGGAARAALIKLQRYEGYVGKLNQD